MLTLVLHSVRSAIAVMACALLLYRVPSQDRGKQPSGQPTPKAKDSTGESAYSVR